MRGVCQIASCDVAKCQGRARVDTACRLTPTHVRGQVDLCGVETLDGLACVVESVQCPCEVRSRSRRGFQCDVEEASSGAHRSADAEPDAPQIAFEARTGDGDLEQPPSPECSLYGQVA